MTQFLKNLKSLVKEKMSALNGTSHSYEHVDRVFKIATFLAKKEKVDVELVQVGALLHDIGWAVGGQHNETGAKLATKILKETDYPKEKIVKIFRIILHHPLAFREELKTSEEKVVWDADKIDLMGIIGIVRAFHWLGDLPFDSVIKRALREFKTIHSMLNTQTARRIAKKRHEETLTLISALEEELSLEDLNISTRQENV